MNIEVQQAIYGEKDKAHQLLSHSGPSDPVYEEIIRFTDFPMLYPQGINWEPYYTGLAYKDLYLICKTFPDTSASRAGMVLTHALLVRLDRIAVCNNIGHLFELLQETPQRQDRLDPIGIILDETQTVASHGESFILVARELLKSTPESLPVLWFGQEGFADLITVLWTNFSSPLRMTFSFGMSFIPDDLRERALTIASTAKSKENSWSSKPIVRASFKEVATPAEAYLLSLPGKEEFSSFLKTLNIEIDSIRKLSLVESCYENFKDIECKNEALSFDQVLSVVRLLEVLCPSGLQAVDIKLRTSASFVGLIAEASKDHIKKLRNLSLLGFENHLDEIRSALTRRLEVLVEHQPLEWFEDVVGDSMAHPEGLLFDSIKEVIGENRNSLAVAPIIWKLWERHSQKITELGPLVPKDKYQEASLIETCPKQIERSLADALTNWCLARKWYGLHFVILCGYLPIADAIRTQSTRIKNKFQPAWLGHLEKRRPKKAIMKAILDTELPELLPAAIDFVKSNSDVLGDINIETPFGQSILKAYLDQAFKDAEPNVQKTIFKLLTLVVDEKIVDQSLLLNIADGPYGDLSLFGQRREIWERLSGAAIDKFLQATAIGWLSRFQGQPREHYEVEYPLRTAIMSHWDFSSVVSESNAASVLVYFYGHFAEATEGRFELDLMELQQDRHKIGLVDAVAIGELIALRGWSRSANRLAGDVLTYNRRDLIPAVKKCSSLLGWYNRGLGWLTGQLDTVNVTEDEWWCELEKLFADLYPMGPQDSEIWSRAKGKKAVLDYNGNGLQRWHSALKDLRNGGGGRKITVAGLMTEAREDFPGNTSLRLLIDLHSKRTSN